MPLITFLLFHSIHVTAQSKVVGRYRDYFGNRIELKTDNSFKYNWNFDMAASWTKGTWTLINDTIYFRMIPIFDTLSRSNGSNLAVDTLILSDDEFAQRITEMQSLGAALSSGGQNRQTYPAKLLFKKERLYKIQDGKLLIKKQKGFWSSKKWDTWYFKSEDSKPTHNIGFLCKAILNLAHL